MQPFLDARTIDNWSSFRDVEIRDDFCRPRVRTGTRTTACSWCIGVSHRTFMLLTPDVDTEKALHSRNHVAYRSLHRLKTIFHNVFVLKRCLSTHDDMQGANKMCSIEKSKINMAIEKSRINRSIIELSRKVGSTG